MVSFEAIIEGYELTTKLVVRTLSQPVIDWRLSVNMPELYWKLPSRKILSPWQIATVVESLKGLLTTRLVMIKLSQPSVVERESVYWPEEFWKLPARKILSPEQIAMFWIFWKDGLTVRFKVKTLSHPEIVCKESVKIPEEL